jgi:hypothetical protein
MHNALEHFTPFYDLGRKFGFKDSQIREYLANGATATVDGRNITLAYEGHTLSGKTKLGRTGRATGWVNQFNTKAQETSNK